MTVCAEYGCRGTFGAEETVVAVSLQAHRAIDHFFFRIPLVGIMTGETGHHALFLLFSLFIIERQTGFDPTSDGIDIHRMGAFAKDLGGRSPLRIMTGKANRLCRLP